LTIGEEVVAVLELSDSKETEFKHPETGETIAIFRPLDSSVTERTIKFHKRRPKYFLSGWDSEDIVTFLKNVVATLADFVDRAYRAYPSQATSFLISHKLVFRMPK
jgi:hypothetical protein